MGPLAASALSAAHVQERHRTAQPGSSGELLESDGAVVDLVTAWTNVKARLVPNAHGRHLCKAHLSVSQRLLPQKLGDVVHPGPFHVGVGCLEQVHVIQLALAEPNLKLGGAFANLLSEANVSSLNAVLVLVSLVALVLPISANFAEEDQVFEEKHMSQGLA